MSLNREHRHLDACVRMTVYRWGLGVDIEDLRMFVDVADAGGVSAAARRLGLAKSIVSRSLSRLETDLGVQLLARTTRGASLTEAGALFREHAAKACMEIDLAREALQPDGELRGRLRIALPLTFGPTHFASVLADLAARHPQLQVHTVYSDRFVDLVTEGFDCAIRVGYLADSSLVARCVGPLHGKLVASPSYIAQYGAPATPDDIPRHQALMQGTESWQFRSGDEVITVRPQGRFKADNGTALAVAAVAGLGVAWLPDGIVEPHLAAGSLQVLMPDYPPPSAGIYVVRPPGRHASRKVRVLTEMLMDCFGDALRSPA